jgi:hypothetical protein
MFAVELSPLNLGQELMFIKKYRYGGKDKEKVISGFLTYVSANLYTDTVQIILVKEVKASGYLNTETFNATVPYNFEIVMKEQ